MPKMSSLTHLPLVCVRAIENERGGITYCNTELHLLPCERTIGFGKRIRCRSPSAKMQPFLFDGYNGQNSLLDADDCLAQWLESCCRSMMREKMCHFCSKQLKITAEDGALLV